MKTVLFNGYLTTRECAMLWAIDVVVVGLCVVVVGRCVVVVTGPGAEEQAASVTAATTTPTAAMHRLMRAPRWPRTARRRA